MSDLRTREVDGAGAVVDLPPLRKSRARMHESPPSTPPDRVYVVDDQAMVCDGVRLLVAACGDLSVCGSADSVASAVAGLLQTRPDVAIVDVRLPGGSGLDVIRHARSEGLATRFLVLTSFADDEVYYEAVVAGASAYLEKTAGPDDILDAVRCLARGGSTIDPGDLRTLADQAVEVDDDDVLGCLTSRERTLLGLIADGRTNREIAAELFLAEKTVRNYVSNVLTKLGLRNRTEVAVLVARRTRTPGGRRLQLHAC